MVRIMDQNGFNGFDEFIKSFNDYISSFTSEKGNENTDNSEETCEECRFSSSNADSTKSQREACSDIPGGFQDIPPQLLLVIGELLGNIIAGNLPFNIQNVVGNWLQLVGQAIEVFNAQQQYYQGGPGRYYNYIYRNVANPFCTSSVDESQKSISVNENEQKSNKGKRSNKNGSSSKSSNTSSEIEELKECICYLTNQIQELKNDIDKLKNQKM